MKNITERISVRDIIDRSDIWELVEKGHAMVLSRVGHRQYPVSKIRHYHNGYRVVYPDGKSAKIKEKKMLDVINVFKPDQSNRKYRFQLSKFGGNWGDAKLIKPESDELDILIEIGDKLECMNGRYQYRIVDSDGNVVWSHI